MHSKPNTASLPSLAEAQATRSLAQIRERFTGDADADAVALAQSLASQLSSLPADDRRLLRRDLAVVTHDLEGLVEALETELGLLASDLKALNNRTGAARAYGQAGIVVPLRRS